MIAAGLLLVVQTAVGPWLEGPPLPLPLANNPVTGLETAAGPAVFSFGGLGAAKRWDAITTRAFRWNVGSEAWVEIAPLPGPPRLAATAQAFHGKVYVFGGYTVAADGSERTQARVDVYDPESDTWSPARPIPVPVDDAVSGVWADSLVMLVSGWRDSANVADVQLYDPASDRWRAGTPIPGTPVFGHTGAVARNSLVYVDGVELRDGRPRYALSAAVWKGELDPLDPTRIRWRRLPDHPGAGVYRGAAVAVGTRVVFVGGSARAYNYDGMGYDGRPASPNALAYAFDVAREVWSRIPAPPPSMDHRGLARAGGTIVLVGGMDRDRVVTDRVWYAPLLDLLTGG